MMLISRIKLNIPDKLAKDKEFRKRFFRGQAQDNIAVSIKSLREKRNMRQIDLAKQADMKQSAVSRIEQADYSGWSFNTLFRVADALEARLRITLEPIEDVLQQYKEKEQVDTEERQYIKLIAVAEAANNESSLAESVPTPFSQRRFDTNLIAVA